MDAAITSFLAKNAIAIILFIYLCRGFGDRLDDIEGNKRWERILRNVGIFLGAIADIFEGALDAIKARRTEKPKKETDQ